MNEEDVCLWLEHALGKELCDKTGITKAFRENMINGDVLLVFEMNMLKDLGVGNSIQKRRIYCEIEKLRKMKELDQKL